MVRDILQTTEGVQVNISSLIKTSKPGKAQPSAFFPYFKEKKQVCIAFTIIHYLRVTKELRADKKQLLLSTKHPHNPIGSQTVSRWIKEVLVETGVSDNFKAHSTRHASTSKALKTGLDISLIKKTAGWSETSRVFNTFYNRPIEENFAQKVFDT